MSRVVRDYKREQVIWKGASPEIKREAIALTQNFTVIDGQAYDTETGENITDRLHIEPVISAAQYEGVQIKEHLRRHQEENGGYVFAFYNAMQAMNERFPSLTQSDMARLMFLGTYVSFNEGEASHGYLRHDNGVPINKRSLRELLGMSRNKYSEFYKKLIDEDIIKELPEGLAVNPTIFYRGEHLDTYRGDYQYTRLFRKTVRDLYEKFNGRPKKLGIIYAILPYVNFNYNIICHNPHEVIEGKVKPMRAKELAEELGYKDYKSMTKAMREIKYNEKSVFKFVSDEKDRRSSYIIVNPNVIYAGNGNHLKAIKVLFN